MKTGVVAALALLICSGAFCADWDLAANGLTGYTVADVIIDPTNANILYCSCKDGVYKSTNGGATWVKKPNGLPATPYAGRLEMDPTNPNRIYVKASDGNGAYIWRTDDGGTNWVKKGTGITLPYLDSVEVSPSNPAIVYCGTIVGGRDGGCFKSTDYGDNWTQVAGSNMPATGLHNDCSPIAIDPADPNRLYCGRTHYDDFLRSTDGGNHWTWMGQRFIIRAVWIDPAATNRILAGGANHIKLSTDYGVTFADVMTGEQISAIASAPSNSSIVYAATTSNGLYKSTDSGITWAQVSGSEDYSFGRVAVHPTDPNTLYCTLQGRGVGKSTDGGHTFGKLTSGLTSVINVSRVAEQPGTGATYAAVNYVGLFRTYDEGATWRQVSSLPYFHKDIAFSRQDPSVMFYVAYPLGEVLKSTDAGFTWNPLPTCPAEDYFNAMAVDPTDHNRILVAGASNKLWLTTDGGQTWQNVRTIAPTPGWWSTGFWGITFDPTNHDRVYAATYSYPLRSDDGGVTWTPQTSLHYTVPYGNPPTNIDTSFVRNIAVDPVTPNVLYACTQWGGVWKSVDYGDHWSLMFNPILDTTNNIIVDSRDHNTIYWTSLGYSGQNTGVFKSTDAGSTWTRINSGLMGNDLYPNLVCQSQANPDRLYVAGQQYGFYRNSGGAWGLTMDQAKALPDGAYCKLAENPVVSLSYGDGSGCLQNADRLRGIRATNLATFVPGDRLLAFGWIRDDAGDKVLDLDTATLTQRLEPPAPLSMGSRAVQATPSPSGIYSRAWGTVREVAADGSWYYLDDGSGAVDSAGHPGLKVRPLNALPLKQDTFAVVEGALSRSSQDGQLVPTLVLGGQQSVIIGTIGNYLSNAGFETGALSPWTAAGTGAQVVEGNWVFGVSAHAGTRFGGAYGYNTTYSGTLYQRVAVPPGLIYSASVWSRVLHGGNDPNSAMSRIGIDPTGGTDPDSASVQWSAWDTEPSWYSSVWRQITTPETTVAGGYCTVFLQYQQQNQAGYHINCFDDAQLFRL